MGPKRAAPLPAGTSPVPDSAFPFPCRTSSVTSGALPFLQRARPGLHPPRYPRRLERLRLPPGQPHGRTPFHPFHRPPPPVKRHLPIPLHPSPPQLKRRAPIPFRLSPPQVQRHPPLPFHRPPPQVQEHPGNLDLHGADVGAGSAEGGGEREGVVDAWAQSWGMRMEPMGPG
jgi:hypothetical protein